MGPVLLLTVLSIPCFVSAWHFAWRDKHTAALVLLLIGGALLRIGMSLDPFLHPWDERYHALVAKHLMEHPLKPTLYEHPALPYEAASWVGGHVWLHKPPFALWCMAASMHLFGMNETAVRIPSILMSTSGIWMCWALVSAWWGRRTGSVAAFLFAIQGALIEFASGRVATDHVDTLFAMLVSASALCCLRFRDRGSRWALAGSGILLGLALLTKWLPALMVLPAQFLFLLGRRHAWKAAFIGTSVILVIAVLIALPWTLYIHARYPEIIEAVDRGRLSRFTEVIDGQGGGPLYYFDRLRIRYGDLVYLPCLWFIWSTVRRKRGIDDRWAILCWFLLPYVVFSCVATKMQGYVLACSIPILAITAAYWTRLEQHMRTRPGWRWLQLSVLSALLALPVRYTIERLKPFEDQRDRVALREQVRALASPGPADSTVVIGPYPIETMFYTPFTAYEQLTLEETERLLAAGYRIVRFDPKK